MIKKNAALAASTIAAMAALLLTTLAQAQTAPPPRVPLAPQALSNGPIHAKDAARFGYLGLVRTRSAAEIRAAGLSHPFGIGGETTDRDYSSFDLWKSYLGPTGALKVRVQSGWHDIEKVITQPPSYDFAKLDKIVDGALARGVEPYVFLGYGNERPGCLNCGTRNLAGALPTGTGKQKFLDYVRATVTRYSQPTARVTDWEIWNEPDGHVPVDQYAQLIVEVAQLIKSIQPQAKLTIGSFTAGVMGGSTTSSSIYAKTAVDYFAANRGPGVPAADVAVAYHPYYASVDHDNFPSELAKYQWFKDMVEVHGFRIRQNENGAPSGPCLYYALCGLAWTEEDQAKYLLRRLLGDFSRGVESSIFTLVDLHYDATKNVKGLLETGTWDGNVDTPYLNGDQTVKRQKVAYRAYQHVTAIFDNRLKLVPDAGCSKPYGYTVQAYTRNEPGGVVRNLIAVWRKVDALPRPTTEASIDITCSKFHFPRFAGNPTLRPRLVDMVDGRVYALNTSDTVALNDAVGNKLQIKGLPVADYPVLLSDQGIVLFD
ncbi:hypothetical protein PEC18_12615 [Paucibacter sp. O1-1]|nr:hypothetical protein [Paucibacter sp. O1-1]MDA3826660.1 hypothetical protein [Paucibacter sp. O1-1]